MFALSLRAAGRQAAAAAGRSSVAAGVRPAPFLAHQFATDSGTGSHPDFEPQKKVEMAADGGEASETGAIIESILTSSAEETPVFLFMKGNPSQPQCGFSNQVVRILHFEGESPGQCAAGP